MVNSNFINCKNFDVPFDAQRCKNLEISFVTSECICSLFLALMIRKTWRHINLCEKSCTKNLISISILYLIFICLILSLVHNIFNIGFFQTSESGKQSFFASFLLMAFISAFVICVIL